MTEGAVDRLLTLAALLMTAIAVAEPAESLWKRWKERHAAVETPSVEVPAEIEPAWFAQARREIDRLTHG